MACGALFFGTVALTSCSNDEVYDINGSNKNAIYFDLSSSDTKVSQIYNTPGGVFGIAGGEFYVKTQYPTENVITASADVDTTLVSKYNKTHSTSYQSLPAEALKAVTVTPAKISSGKNVSDTTLIVRVPSSSCNSLTGTYLVPLRLKVENVSGPSVYNAGLRDTMVVAYAVVKNAGSDYVYTTSNMEQENTVVITPVGIFGGVKDEFNVAVRAKADGNITIKATVDNSLVSTYNSTKGTNYSALPSDVLSKLKVTDGTITAGTMATSPGVKVTDPSGVCKNLKGNYILPLRLTVVYPNGATQEIATPAYVLISSKETLINDNATGLLGTACSDQVSQKWTCVSTDAFDASDFSGLFSGSSWPVKTSNTTGYFIIDLGQTHKVSAFSINGYVMKDFTMSVSTDGSSYTELGNTNEHNTIYDSDWNAWYVLYAGVPARYVKVFVNFDPSSWAWYSSYKVLSSFKLAFDD